MIRIFSILFLLIVPFSFTFASDFSLCPDESYLTVAGDNGVSYGWYQDATCIVENVPADEEVVEFPSCPDESYLTIAGDNGVNYGWYQDATCIVENVPAVEEVVEFPSCPDKSYITVAGDNGVSYGWYQDATCVVEEVPVEDNLSQSLVMLDGKRILSESLQCFYAQSTGSDDLLSLQIQYLSAPNAVAFALYMDDPLPATPFAAIAGQQGLFYFEAFSNAVSYSDTLANSEIEIQLESLPSPSELSDGDIVSLKGNILINEFSLIEVSFDGTVGSTELLLAAQTIEVDCEAQYQESLVFD